MCRRLLPIPVEGYGTRDAESLVSYIYRVAYDHGISVGSLISWAFEQAVTSGVVSELDKPKEYKLSVLECTGDNKTSRKLSSVFSYLTYQDLSNSTLAFLKDSTGRSVNEIRKEVHWCPFCFNEWYIQGQHSYFKLIWQLTAVEYCPIHNVKLIGLCPKCKKHQNSLKRDFPIEYCQRCGEPLWDLNSYAERNLLQICDSWKSDSSDMELLFEDIALYGNSNISYDNLRKSLDHLLDYYWKLDREKELFDILPMNKLLCVIDGIRMLSLKMIRRFASQMNIPLYDLFTGNAHQTSATLDFTEYCSLPPLLDFSHRQANNHEEIFKRIVEVRRQNKDAPLPLKQFAKEVGTSVGYLEYRHPALCKQVVQDSQAYLEKLRNDELQLAKVVALKYFLDRRNAGEYCSRKQAFKDLRAETGLPKFKLKDAIQAAYTAIN